MHNITETELVSIASALASLPVKVNGPYEVSVKFQKQMGEKVVLDGEGSTLQDALLNAVSKVQL